MSQSDVVKRMIDVLIASGIRNKTTIYSKLVLKTGLKRSTIRRITGEYKRDVERKIKILSNDTKLKRVDGKPYSFIPIKIRFLWLKITQNDLDEIRCSICKKQIGYIDGFCEGSLVCDSCRYKFPQKEKKKIGKRN